MNTKSIAMLIGGILAGGTGSALISSAIAEPRPITEVVFYPSVGDVKTIYDIAGKYTDCDFVGLRLGDEMSSIDGGPAVPTHTARGLCK